MKKAAVWSGCWWTLECVGLEESPFLVDWLSLFILYLSSGIFIFIFPAASSGREVAWECVFCTYPGHRVSDHDCRDFHAPHSQDSSTPPRTCTKFLEWHQQHQQIMNRHLPPLSHNQRRLLLRISHQQTYLVCSLISNRSWTSFAHCLSSHFNIHHQREFQVSTIQDLPLIHEGLLILSSWAL